MRHRPALLVLAAAIAAVCSASTTFAQEQTGSIEGTVRDPQGAVLTGTNLRALSVTAGSVLQVTTDARGQFRFVSLGPGYYDITASATGFETARFERVEILLGQIKRLDFILTLATVREAVVVAAASPLVDVKQSARGFSLRREQLTALPRGLDYTSVLHLMPGSNAEPKLGGLSIDGASAAENRFIVDGIDTTNVMTGLPGQYVNVDNVDELQVKSSGYAAEYGGSTGGVINVLTRSGTNAWHGDVRFNLGADRLDSGPRPTLRRNPQVSTLAEYLTYPKDAYTAIEPGVSLGGPIARDRAFIYAAYQPLIKHIERGVTFALDGSQGTFTQDLTRHLMTISQTMQFGARGRTRASFNLGTTRTRNVLPAQAGSDSPVSNFGPVTSEPDWTASFTADLAVSSRLSVSGRAGYLHQNIHTEGIRTSPRFVFTFSNIGLLDVPASLQRVTAFTTDTNNYDFVKDRLGRLSAQIEATLYVSGWGEHSIKGGLQASWSTNDVNRGQKANVVTLAWNRALQGLRGTYGYYRVTSNSVDPRRGTIFLGKTEGRALGLFVQDAWNLGRRVTVNAGVRTEQETVPRYSRPGGNDAPIIRFGFRDKLAPRLGVAWDVRGDGRLKVYGSWGVFYDIFKYSLSTAFGGTDTQGWAFTLDTYDWPGLVDNPACPPACPGTRIIGPVSGFVASTDAIDPSLEPMRSQEAVAGIEYQLRPNLLAAARYVHKQLDRAVEDIGSLDANFNEIYTIGNPGFGRSTIAFPGVALPRAAREYDGVEIAVRRPPTNRWAYSLSYLWSRLYGNYSGLSQSDENGRVSPNVARLYDHSLMMYDEKGRPVYGRLATDRPHQVKASLMYLASFGLNVGIFGAVSSGLPVTREAAVIPPSYYPIQYLGRMSDGRTPVLSQLDTYLQQEFRLFGKSLLSIGVTVSNLLNQSAVTSRFSNETETAAGLAISEADLYGGRLDFRQLFATQAVPKDPRFLMANAYQPPRTARVMIKWTF